MHAKPVGNSETPQHLAAFDAEEVSTVVYADYIGGYFGPVNMLVAQDGVYSTTTSINNTQKGFVSAQLGWSNGFDIGFTHDTGTGYHVGAKFNFLINDSNTKGSLNKGADYDNMGSTFNLDAFTGSDPVTSANGNYSLKGLYEGRVYSVLPVTIRDGVYFLGTVGVLGGYVKHTSTVVYTIAADETEQALFQQDQLGYGGPYAAVQIAKELGESFLFYGSFGGSARGATNNHTSRSSNSDDGVLLGYDVNTAGNLYNFIQTVDVSLGLMYSYILENEGSISATLAWESGVWTNGTRLFSNTAGSNSNQTQDIVYGTLKAGIGLRY